MLNAAVPQIILDQPGVSALIRQGVSTGMAQHVRMCGYNPRHYTIRFHQCPNRSAVKRLPSFTQEKDTGVRSHVFPAFQPGSDSPQLISPERMGGGQSMLQSDDMQYTAVQVNLVSPHAAGFRDPQAMPEHKQQEAPITHVVAGSLCRLDEPGHFRLGQMFSCL